MNLRRLAIAAACSGALLAEVGYASSPTDEAAAAFARLKTLVGEWQTENGAERLSYELVAGDTTLVERETGGGRPTMLTLYHRDGGRLVLTHYCMAGNQPRMEARRLDPNTSELRFEFVDATNLPNPAAGHMHSVAIRFVDANHIETVWQFHQDGKATMTEKARYTRVKQAQVPR